MGSVMRMDMVYRLPHPVDTCALYVSEHCHGAWRIGKDLIMEIHRPGGEINLVLYPSGRMCVYGMTAVTQGVTVYRWVRTQVEHANAYTE